MSKRRKKRKPTAEQLRSREEDAALRETRSSNGSTGMCSEGFRPPIQHRFGKHEEKKSAPIVKLSIREMADLLYKRDHG